MIVWRSRKAFDNWGEKFVVGLGDRVAPTDIEEGMRVGYEYFCASPIRILLEDLERLRY